MPWAEEKKLSQTVRIVSLLLLATLSGVALAQSSSGFTVVNIKPVIDRKSALNPPSAPSNLTAHDNGIQYHGGPVLSTAQGVNVYFIWYGNWSSPSDTAAQSIVTDFIKNLGGSPYFNMNATYYDYGAGGPDPVRNRVNYISSTTDNYSRGTALSDQDVGSIFEQTIASGKFPLDQNGAYFVITSADVDETSGSCTTYCAWHGVDVLTPFRSTGSALRSPSSVNVPVALVGNPDRCPAFCAWQDELPTPNNNVAGDGMVNLIAHELSETVSDPRGTAWYSFNQKPKGQENGDLCQWTFGQTTNLPNGSFYNVTLGDRNYLLQRIWVNALGGYCSLSWVNGAN